MNTLRSQHQLRNFCLWAFLLPLNTFPPSSVNHEYWSITYVHINCAHAPAPHKDVSSYLCSSSSTQMTAMLTSTQSASEVFWGHHFSPCLQTQHRTMGLPWWSLWICLTVLACSSMCVWWQFPAGQRGIRTTTIHGQPVETVPQKTC